MAPLIRKVDCIRLYVSDLEAGLAFYRDRLGHALLWRTIVPPFDIQIGRCVVLEDPWGNPLVLLDTSKGLLKTDADGNVIGNID